MRFKLISIIVFLIITVIFSGCTRNYVVKPFNIEPALVPKFQANGSINLINAQIPGTQKVFRSGPAINWVGDLYEWTGQAIELLASELEQRKMKVSPDSAKTLKLSVTEGKLLREATGVRCVITLKVIAGNGYSKEFIGENIHRASPFGEMARYYAGANALTEAVIAILNDKELIRYFEE
ncbi:MAG: hypothetical protein JW914_01320 [Syntrophaceae bacterium]|nr:hypothetical protein [Syntrophaceae bacterium]